MFVSARVAAINAEIEARQEEAALLAAQERRQAQQRNQGGGESGKGEKNVYARTSAIFERMQVLHNFLFRTPFGCWNRMNIVPRSYPSAYVVQVAFHNTISTRAMSVKHHVAKDAMYFDGIDSISFVVPPS